MVVKTTVTAINKANAKRDFLINYLQQFCKPVHHKFSLEDYQLHETRQQLNFLKQLFN
jgi:hypothetical protein